MITRIVTGIVLHCSATPDDRACSIEDIEKWHQARGFKRSAEWLTKFNPRIRHVGYHRFIDRTGQVWPGRHYDEIGAHVQGANAKSVGLCLAGTSKYTYNQWLTLKWTLISLTRELADGRIPDADIINTPEQALKALGRLGISIKGHRDYSPDQDGDGVVEEWEWVKTCPGFAVADWLKAGMPTGFPGHTA